MDFKTEQELLWACEKWGSEYIKRNDLCKLKNNINLFSKVISLTKNIDSVIEFGSNIGLNLLALKQILPDIEFSAIEINSEACKVLKSYNFIKNIYNKSSKYIFIGEYYNPVPIKLKYRGQENKLFKWDFAGEMLEKYSDLELVDYGFVYHCDNNFPMNDINWFLLKKKFKI